MKMQTAAGDTKPSGELSSRPSALDDDPYKPARPRRSRHRLRWLSLVAVILAGSLVLASYPRYRAEMRDTRAEILAGSRIVSTSAGPIEYAETGQGPPVLIAHGNGGGYDQGLVAGRMFIGDGYRLIAPSRFGYLRTPLPQDGSATAQADAYAALLDTLGIDQVAIAAVSDGGPSAMQFALRHPERTTALIMMSAKSHTPPPDSAVQSLLFNTLFRSDYVYWSVTRLFESSLLALLGVPADVQAAMTRDQTSAVGEYLRLMHPVSMRKAGIYNDRDELSFLPPASYPLERIGAPTLVVHGTLDSLQPFSHGEHASEGIPGARLMALEQGGHIPVDHLDEVLAEVQEFLESTNRSTS